MKKRSTGTGVIFLICAFGQAWLFFVLLVRLLLPTDLTLFALLAKAFGAGWSFQTYFTYDWAAKLENM